MAFQLQAAKFDTYIPDSKSNMHALIRCEFKIARGATGDTNLDIYDTTGTFWNAAIADAKYGPIATNTWLPKWTQIASNIRSVDWVNAFGNGGNININGVVNSGTTTFKWATTGSALAAQSANQTV